MVLGELFVTYIPIQVYKQEGKKWERKPDIKHSNYHFCLTIFLINCEILKCQDKVKKEFNNFQFSEPGVTSLKGLVLSDQQQSKRYLVYNDNYMTI